MSNPNSHSQDELALTLQREGHTLTRVAADLFSYQVVKSGDETYLLHPLTQDFSSVIKADSGLELQHTPFRGYNTNVLEFVMDHNSSVASPLAAADYIRTRLKAPAA